MTKKDEKVAKLTLTGPGLDNLIPEIETLVKEHKAKVAKKEIKAGGYPVPTCCSKTLY